MNLMRRVCLDLKILVVSPFESNCLIEWYKMMVSALIKPIKNTKKIDGNNNRLKILIVQ